MRRTASLALAAVSVLAAQTRADLSADVRRVLVGLKGATSAAEVIRLGETRDADVVIAAVNPDQPLIPASNLKVITTSDALTTLGVDFRFRTRLMMKGNDLAIVGDGDPTFGDTDYLEGTGWGVTTVFENWAAQLKTSGITHVEKILVDDSIFEENMFQPNWPENQAHKDYVPQVAGINFNANCLNVYVTKNADNSASARIEPDTKYVTVQNQITVGPQHSLYLSRILGGNKIVMKGQVDGTNHVPFRVTIHDPPMYAGTVLAETLAKNGVAVGGAVVRDRTVRAAIDAPTPSPDWKLIAANETPLVQIVPKTNKESINLYAESFAKRIAAKRFDKPGSWALVADSQQAFMKIVGAPATAKNVFDDGCGLSKKDAVAPSAFCATLSFMFHGPLRQTFIDSLAIGGVDGTLGRRYKDNGLAGRVHGKSGSVSGVSTLSGYLVAKNGTWYAFSILNNDIADRGAAQRAQDEIVRLVDVDSANGTAKPIASPTSQGTGG